LSRQFWRYFLVSAIALGFDYASLFALVAAGVREWTGAALAYCGGAVVHYVLSRRFVFARGWLHARPVGEFGAFAASGALGLAITAGVVYLATEVAGMALAVGKTLAVGASFFSVYLMRRAFVFRPSHRPLAQGRGER